MTDTRKFLTANGWSDDRLMNAYDLLWDVQQASKELGIDADFVRVLASIEVLSGTMAEVRAELDNDPQADALADIARDTVRAEQRRGA